MVLTGDENSGGKLYEAARLLKSVVGDRAYMLIAERVDVAAAVGASGVLLSDQGSLFFFFFLSITSDWFYCLIINELKGKAIVLFIICVWNSVFSLLCN